MISNWSKISSALPEHSPGTLFHNCRAVTVNRDEALQELFDLSAISIHRILLPFLKNKYTMYGLYRGGWFTVFADTLGHSFTRRSWSKQ